MTNTPNKPPTATPARTPKVSVTRKSPRRTHQHNEVLPSKNDVAMETPFVFSGLLCPPVMKTSQRTKVHHIKQA